MGLKKNNLYSFTDSTVLYNFYKSGIKIPEAYFFSKNKRYIDYRSEPNQCNGGVLIFMDSLFSKKTEISNDSVLFNKLIENIVPLSQNSIMFPNEADCDFYAIFYWAKFLGHNNKLKLLEWERKISELQAKGINICHIKITTDFMDYYGFTEKEIETMIK